jgi:hypothetical protein
MCMRPPPFPPFLTFFYSHLFSRVIWSRHVYTRSAFSGAFDLFVCFHWFLLDSVERTTSWFLLGLQLEAPPRSCRWVWNKTTALLRACSWRGWYLYCIVTLNVPCRPPLCLDVSCFYLLGGREIGNTVVFDASMQEFFVL